MNIKEGCNRLLILTDVRGAERGRESAVDEVLMYTEVWVKSHNEYNGRQTEWEHFVFLVKQNKSPHDALVWLHYVKHETVFFCAKMNYDILF